MQLFNKRSNAAFAVPQTIRRISEYGEYQRVEEADGTLYMYGPAASLTVLPDGPGRLFVRTGMVKGIRDSSFTLKRMPVGELFGVRLYMLGRKFLLTRENVNFRKGMESRFLPLPPNDGNVYVHMLDMVRLYIKDGHMFLTVRALEGERIH